MSEHEQGSDFDRTIAGRLAQRVILNTPGRGNPKLGRLIDRVYADDDLYALWLAANVNAVERLGMTDLAEETDKVIQANYAGVSPDTVGKVGKDKWWKFW